MGDKDVMVLEEDVVDVDQDKVVVEGAKVEEAEVMEVEVEVDLSLEVEEWVEAEAILETEIMGVMISTYLVICWNHCHHFRDY